VVFFHASDFPQGRIGHIFSVLVFKTSIRQQAFLWKDFRPQKSRVEKKVAKGFWL
jgi:hypothetical protein